MSVSVTRQENLSHAPPSPWAVRAPDQGRRGVRRVFALPRVPHLVGEPHRGDGAFGLAAEGAVFGGEPDEVLAVRGAVARPLTERALASLESRVLLVLPGSDRQ